MSLPKVRGNLPSIAELYKSHEYYFGENSSGKRQLLWEKMWDTTNKDYGRFSLMKTNAYTKTSETFSRKEKAPTPAKDRLYSRHLTSASVNEMTSTDTTDERPPQSPSKQRKSADESQSTSKGSSTSKYVLPKCLPGGKVMPKPSCKEETNNFTRGLSAIDRSRKNLTSGYAKNYVKSTESFMWRAIEDLRD